MRALDYYTRRVLNYICYETAYVHKMCVYEFEGKLERLVSKKLDNCYVFYWWW